MILTKLNIIETDGNWGALEIMKSFYSELYDKENLFWISKAISDEDDNEIFYEYDEIDPSTSRTTTYKSPKKRNIKLTSSKIDTIVENYKLENIDILKIDIEGNSSKALMGAKKIIKKGIVRLFEVELLANNKQEFDGVFKCFINSQYRLYSVKTCSEYISKSTYKAIPVPIIFDLLFVKNELQKRDKEILNFLGYDEVKKSEKVNFVDKIISVIFDFISHFLKKIYPRAYYRKIESDNKTLFKK